MKGTLFGVGVGPGDPELMTLKAHRILSEAHIVAVPKTAWDKDSLALSIARQAVGPDKEILELLFPMTHNQEQLQESWDQAALTLSTYLDQGKTVAFITLGDPSLYSTYLYLHHRAREKGYHTEIIPGVPSFCAAAGALGLGLAENRESVAVVPSVDEWDHLKEVLAKFDTIVLMKVAKNLPRLKVLLQEQGLLDKSVLVSRCGMAEEAFVYHWGDLADQGTKVSYFSTMIVKKSGVKQP